jgi:hypothetical protein
VTVRWVQQLDGARDLHRELNAAVDSLDLLGRVPLPALHEARDLCVKADAHACARTTVEQNGSPDV